MKTKAGPRQISTTMALGTTIPAMEGSGGPASPSIGFRFEMGAGYGIPPWGGIGSPMSLGAGYLTITVVGRISTTTAGVGCPAALRSLVSWSGQLGARSFLGRLGPLGALRAVVRLPLQFGKYLRLEEF